MKMVFCFVSCCFVNCYLIDYAGLLDKRRMVILILLLIAAVFSSGNTITDDHHVTSCHSVKISECMKFNHSTIPDLDYTEINSTFGDVGPLFSSGCSNYIQFLVCFMLEPTCHAHHYNMSGMSMTINFKAHLCRSFCEAVQRDCYCYGAFWTSALNCSQLPDVEEGCFMPDDFAGNGTSNDTTAAWRSCVPDVNITNTTNATDPRTSDTDNECRGRLVYYPGVSYGGEEDCAAPCHYMYEEDRFSTGLVTALFVLWSVLSALALVSFGSFLLTWKHYSHIEQPYHFLALCHVFVFVAFLIRLGSGHDGMVCDVRHRDISDTALITEDVTNGSCTVVFIIVYYSILAISVWHVNLSVALATRALTKWKHHLQMYYHLSGWGVPLIFVIAACIHRMVSGENLFGMCQLDDQYLVMVFGPVMVCVVLSFILLSSAVIQMVFCSQAYVEVEHKHRGRFIRSLVFGLIVLIELSVIAVLYLVEYVTYEDTETYYTECVEPKNPLAPDCSSRTITKPTYVIPIIRYSLISLVGAISIMWPLFRRVTWTSWKDSATLLYQKIVNSFSQCRHLRSNSRHLRSNSTAIVQMATLVG